MSAAPDDGIETCVACRCRLGTDSYVGYMVNRLGLAMFRLCPHCRETADDTMLARIGREAEQQLLRTAPGAGHA